jgi:hypothetical protein
MTLGKARRTWWRAQREQASTPPYTIEVDAEGSWVALGADRVAGPLTNAEAWSWIDRRATARRYGAGR